MFFFFSLQGHIVPSLEAIASRFGKRLKIVRVETGFNVGLSIDSDDVQIVDENGDEVVDSPETTKMESPGGLASQLDSEDSDLESLSVDTEMKIGERALREGTGVAWNVSFFLFKYCLAESFCNSWISLKSLIILGYYQIDGNGLVRGKITGHFPDGSFVLSFVNGRKFRFRELNKVEQAW